MILPNGICTLLVSARCSILPCVLYCTYNTVGKLDIILRADAKSLQIRTSVILGMCPYNAVK